MAKTEKKTKVIDGSKYYWKNVTSLTTMLTALSGGSVKEQVQIENATNAKNEYGDRAFYAYDVSLSFISEAVLLENGKVVVCCTVSEWQGTMSSHDVISVRYYVLEPV